MSIDQLKAEIPDEENPELSNEFFAVAKPASELLPEKVFAKIQKKRGAQKHPKKQPISIRLSPEVVTYFRSTGKGWQSRLDNILLEYVRSRSTV